MDFVGNFPMNFVYIFEAGNQFVIPSIITTSLGIVVVSPALFAFSVFNWLFFSLGQQHWIINNIKRRIESATAAPINPANTVLGSISIRFFVKNKFKYQSNFN